MTLRKNLPLIGLFLFTGFLFGCASAKNAADRGWRPSVDSRKTHEDPYDGLEKSSFYLTMRDGVKIAVDLYLPKGLRKGEKIPAILLQTRYFRALHLYWPTSAIVGIPEELTRIVRHGYAVVRTDVRGTGASFGTQPNPWPSDAILDGAQIVNWIIAQPWSNGNVGSAGGSYEGTTAEFLLVNRHPAVKAIAPMWALYDVYADIAFPGGIALDWFTRVWQKGNVAMDTNNLRIAAWYAPLFTRGVMPVDSDKDRSLLRQAVAQHAGNVLVHDEARQITYRDDVSSAGFSMESFSPHNYQKEIRASGAAIYNFSGWFDGGYQHAAIKRFLTIRGERDKLTLGPWEHGGEHVPRPFSKTRKAGFDHVDEVMRFFDDHLKGIETGIDREPPVHYFTMVEDAWKTAPTWPPPSAAPKAYYFAAAGVLTDSPPQGSGEDEYKVDLSAGTGSKTRWNCLAVSVAVSYRDREKQDKKLLIYQTGPLARDVEVTGHPIVTLYVSSDKEDGEFFAYLEDVDEKNRVAYVTEGMLRAVHRKISDEPPPYALLVPYHSYLRKDASPLTPGEVAEITFDLLPVSYLFKTGHRIRIAVAGADADLFLVLPGDPPTLRIQRTHEHPSRIVLPVMPRGS